MIKAQTLKGFRDFLPGEARKRQYVINKLRGVFESFGFEPLETPALEYEEVLLGKYGDEGDKLMYRFTDNGGRKVALRYDQTVPLARVTAQYGNQLPTPFKRYQIQSVWRAENPQKGRFREFLQCDIDTVGPNSTLADAEIIACLSKTLSELGFKNYKIKINNRKVFEDLLTVLQLPKPYDDVIAKSIAKSVDKLNKIGKENVIKEMKESPNIDPQFLDSTRIQLFDKFLDYEDIPISQTEDFAKFMRYDPGWLIDLRNIAQNAIQLGAEEDKIFISPTLARGLDYYTGLILEVEIEDYEGGSVCGGGRYDNLIGMFIDQDYPGDVSVPAVGLAFGFDRIVEAMTQLNLFPADLATTKVLVTVFSKELLDKSVEITLRLRSGGINTELWLDPEAKLDKQLKYADQKGIPYVIIIGPEETAKNEVTIKNLTTQEQRKVKGDMILSVFKY